MKIEHILSKYANKGEFSFSINELLKNKCNAPTNLSGIYLIYNDKELIYIGSSGRKINNKLVTRKSGLGGMKDRIVNGYHPKFGKIKRHKAFPQQMIIERISTIKIKWYVTYDYNTFLDFPTDVEKLLMNIYLNKYNKKPIWHK